jgi:hypothetical protein
MYDTPKALRSRDSDRRRRYEENLQFYRGAQWPTTRTPYARQGGARQLVFNYARTFITKAASYTMNDLTFTADPLDKSARAIANAAAAELALLQVAEQNALDVLDFNNEIDCSVLGDAAYKVTWDPVEGRVRVTAPDITSIFVWRRPDDATETYRVAQRYTLPADDALHLYGYTSNRRTAEIIEDWTPAEFTTWVNSEAVSVEANPYGFIPYIVYPNISEPQKEWGESDIPAILDSARELNRLLTQLSSIAELSGNPIAVLEGVTESIDIAVQPGAMWELPEGAKAYLLDLLRGGGVTMMLQYAELVRTTLHDLAESPRSAFGDNPQGLSGVALKVSLDPLVKKINRKRLIRTRALILRNGMILALLARYAGLDAAVAAHVLRPSWGDVNPNDRTRDIADSVAAVNAGIYSRHRAASELGVPEPEEELTRWLDESKRIAAVQPTQTPAPAKLNPDPAA